MISGTGSNSWHGIQINCHDRLLYIHLSFKKSCSVLWWIFFTWSFYLTWSGTGSRIIELIRTWHKQLRIHSLVIITHFIVPHCWQLQTKCTVFLIVRPFLKILLQYGLRFLRINWNTDSLLPKFRSAWKQSQSFCVCGGGEEPPVAGGICPAWRLHSTWAEAWKFMDVR